MSTGTHLITAEQFAEMHFDVPVELVRGEIVYLYGEDGMTLPGMRHGVVCSNATGILRDWCRGAKAGWVPSHDTAVVTERDPDTLRGPDVCFVSTDRIPSGKVPVGIMTAIPNLCVEILSPSDRWSQVRRKVMEFLDRGVSEVWVLDPDRRSLFAFANEEPPHEFRGEETVTSPVLPGFSCPVSDFFEDT